MYIARSATLDNKDIKAMKEKKKTSGKKEKGKLQRSASLTSNAAAKTASTAGHGPADGDSEGWVHEYTTGPKTKHMTVHQECTG